MTTLKDLMVRYPYQFSGPYIYLSFARGWFALFVQLCENVDQLLGENKRHFHWTQTKEKFGVFRIYYVLDGMYEDDQDFPARLELLRKISDLKQETEEASSRICAYCGAPGHLVVGPWTITLCDDHHRAREAGTLPSIWHDEGLPSQVDGAGS